MSTGTLGLLVGCGVLAYFVPMFVALERGCLRWQLITVITVVFGWTVVGWGLALVLAWLDVTHDEMQARVSDQLRCAEDNGYDPLESDDNAIACDLLDYGYGFPHDFAPEHLQQYVAEWRAARLRAAEERAT